MWIFLWLSRKHFIFQKQSVSETSHNARLTRVSTNDEIGREALALSLDHLSFLQPFKHNWIIVSAGHSELSVDTENKHFNYIVTAQKEIIIVALRETCLFHWQIS